MAMASILSSPRPALSLCLPSSFNPLQISSSSSHFSLDLTYFRIPPSYPPSKSSLNSSYSYSGGLTRGLGSCVEKRKNGVVLGWGERKSVRMLRHCWLSSAGGSSETVLVEDEEMKE